MTVIPISSALYRDIHNLAHHNRLVFMTGLPGVGKSLLTQQLALIAHAAGRRVHILRYNEARQPFESEEILAHYPEVDGVTDPMIRKAVGVWARQAVVRWAEAHPDPDDFLIGELPLIGGRLVELAIPANDAAEGLLQGPQSRFVIPIPSWEVREIIEKRRARTLADPQHEQEKLDAPPNVLRQLWQEVNQVARQIGLTKTQPNSPYNPYIYGGVFEMLLRHRPAMPLLIEEVLRPNRSVYDLEIGVSRLRPTKVEAAAMLRVVERDFPPHRRHELLDEWHHAITSAPSPADPGPQLRLPMPETLPGTLAKTKLSEFEKKCLKRLMSQPLDAPVEIIRPLVDAAITALDKNVPENDSLEAAVLPKFDIYDSYFNVVRTNQSGGRVFLIGLLQAYRNVLENLDMPPAPLTVVEKPLLRMALETTLQLFL